MNGVPQVDFPTDTYECIVLYPGAATGELDEVTLGRLRREHVRYLLDLQRRGVILVAGAMTGPAGAAEPPCGFGLCRTGSVDEVRALVEDDPAVRAGVYRVDVMTFLTPANSLAFPQAEGR